MFKPVIRLIVCLLMLAVPSISSAELLYALSAVGHLHVYETSVPVLSLADIPVTGVTGDHEELCAIDFRPRDGQLYGLGCTRNAATPIYSARLYRIHMLTGVATPIGTIPLPFGPGDVGFDFDPVTDRVRVVTTGGLNYRVNPDTGRIVDGDITQPGSQRDKDLPAASRISAIAYSNNVADASVTTLYGIDTSSRELVRVGGVDGTPSPNLGSVTPVGPLNELLASSVAGLDVVGPGDRAYVLMDVVNGPGAASALFRIELANGTVTFVESIVTGSNSQPIDIAVLSRPVTMYGLTSDNRLVTFSSHAPSAILTDVAIAGLTAGENLRAIDVRPDTGEIYAISSTTRVYTLNPITGVATLVGPDSQLSWPESAGMSFDPVSGQLRAVDANSRAPFYDLTEPVQAFDDLNLNANGADFTGIVGIAHASDPFTGTALYGVTSTTNDLVLIGPNNVVSKVAPINLDVFVRAGLDVDPASNTLYLMNEVTNDGWFLYLIDRHDGKATLMGHIGPLASFPNMQGLAVALPGTARFETTSVDVDETAGTITVKVVRGAGRLGPFSVDYATQTGGSAAATQDFTPVTGTLIFLDGETSKDITIPILNDAAIESLEQFTLALAAPTLGGRLASPSTMAIRIVDDEKVQGQLPSIAITTPTTSPTFETGALLLDLAGTASDDGSIVSVTWTSSLGDAGTVQGTTAWVIPALELDDDTPTVITVTAHDNLGQTSSDSITVTRAASGLLTYVLAEGATGAFFDTDVLLANPSTDPATVTLTFLKEDGSTVVETRTLPGTSRLTVRVDAIPGMEATAASTIVTSTGQIIVERTMRWADGGGYGAHTEKAVEGAAETWYFAEGSQGFFSTYLLLANPQASENTATVTYLREGESPLTRTYALAPKSRFTVDASADGELVNRSFGMIVTFAAPGVAERAMYFGRDPFWKAGHESAGVTLPSATWFLAEGATGPFFETFILLSNPQTTAADVTLTFLIAGGAPVTKTKTVPAQGRLTVNIEQEDAALANVAVATQVAASAPIVVERAQYWPFTFDQWYEAHNSFGVVALNRFWGLAEGRVGGADGYETYILLANPGADAATVTITFLRTNGTTVAKTFVVPPQSRFNVSTGPGGPVPELANEEFGARIESDRPIAVERAMYSSPGGLTWSAGTNATATRLVVP